MSAQVASRPLRTPTLYPGNVVRLRSGNQKMVAETQTSSANRSVRCCWHDAEGKLWRDWFVSDSLDIVPR